MKKTIKNLSAAALVLGGINLALADECAFTVNSSDAMQFDQSVMEAPASCEKITVTLNHTGSLPVASMGHNWVLTTTDNFNDVATAGMSEGLANDYLPQDDERVLAATSMIGGGDSTEVTFDVSALSADESYTFFCSFPGHWAIMKGEFKLAG